MKILVSNVNPSDDAFFVPLIYGNLRSYSESLGHMGFLEWLSPHFIPSEFEKINELYAADVLAISCYQWNVEYQYKLAQFFKKINPNGYVIAGGPQVEYKKETFFSENPEIDFIIPFEGEIAFCELMLQLQLPKTVRDFSKVSGCLFNPKFGNYEMQATKLIDMSFRPSPWLSLQEFWVNLFEKYKNYRLALSFESARGCPYACTFCDWGSSTNSKMRLTDTEVAKNEMTFIQQRLKPFFVFWTDSNLGMAKRDIDLVKHFAQNKKQYGSPKFLYYSNNKNSYESNLEIAKQFKSANLITKYTLSIQHTDLEILKNIKRKNLSQSQIEHLIDEIKKIDYPIFLQLIIGCPGDTLSKWIRAFCTLMEKGVHSEYRVYPFNLLPNSPAADPEYLKSWQIKTISRPDHLTFYYAQNENMNWSPSRSKYIVETSSYTLNDYVNMQLFTWFIQAFHDHGFTQVISKWLSEKHSISYEEFYTYLFNLFLEDGYFSQFKVGLENHIRNWLSNENAIQIVKSTYTATYIEAQENLVFQLYENFESLYDSLMLNLTKKFPIKDLSFVIEYQKSILHRPERTETYTLYNKVYNMDDQFFFLGKEAWYFAKDEIEKNRKFYRQIVQHNFSSNTRTVFKKINRDEELLR